MNKTVFESFDKEKALLFLKQENPDVYQLSTRKDLDALETIYVVTCYTLRREKNGYDQ